MSILNRFKRNKNVPANATFRLTQEGREKLQDFKGDAKSRVLVALEGEGTSTPGEIAGASGLSRGQVERLIPSLVRGGYIQYISNSVAEDNE